MPFCNQCGREYSLGEQVCSNCAAHLPVPLHEPLPESQASPAPRLKRTIAGVIDISLAYLLFYLFIFVFGRRSLIVMVIRIGIGLLPTHLYLLLKDSMEGKSIGKLIMGVIVYNEKEKRPAGLLDSIIRNWYLAIPLLGPTLVALVIGAQILSGRPKRLGERDANTVVITDSEYLRRR